MYEELTTKTPLEIVLIFCWDTSKLHYVKQLSETEHITSFGEA